MGEKSKNIISISRRTDIPKWHTEWLFYALSLGEVTYQQPGAGLRTVSLQPGEVHSLIFWSKDYGRFLRHPKLLKILEQYNVYFHFTITGLGGSFLEPRVSPYSETLAQAKEMVRVWGPERINWRFDPIIHWLNSKGKVCSNAEHFEKFATRLTQIGITRCTFSLCFWYGKCINRAGKYNLRYIDPVDQKKFEILYRMKEKASSLRITLYSCAGDKWTTIPGIKKSHCVDGRLLTQLHPNHERASQGKDKSQRSECGCTPSVDIGSYSQRCFHGCLYCYANPII